jgi:hypothetical protein
MSLFLKQCRKRTKALVVCLFGINELKLCTKKHWLLFQIECMQHAYVIHALSRARYSETRAVRYHQLTHVCVGVGVASKRL